ncbi:hypothetical protein [Emticicia sp. SJ17W-69]|uniref:hypothetical protein n=1 Tax=Emticicia sp. SJ17W-69 TaxID=3421657 RepID=UPI003EC050D3
MQAEKFYKEIQQKIDQTDFEPTWNRAEVWQRIEQKQGKRKTPFVWWKAIAASVILVGGISIYFLKNSTKNIDNQTVAVNTPVINSQTNIQNITESTQVISLQTPTISRNNNSKTITIVAPKNELIAGVDESNLAEKTSANEQVLPAIEEKTMATNTPILSDVTTQETTFIAHPALLEKRAPKKRERVAILEIPEDDESYNMPKKEKSKGFMARLTRKKGKNSTEENNELPSLNAKPNKVWAFVKESFKNETMVVDSTDK